MASYASDFDRAHDGIGNPLVTLELHLPDGYTFLVSTREEQIPVIVYDKDIPIANLYLDLQNPRHEPVSNQREALESMLSDDPMKTLRLAEHIVANGVNPADRPIVIPYEGDGDENEDDDELFTMLEGNRRLTALHLLEEPSRIPRTLAANIQKRFRELAATYEKNPLRKLPCVVFPDRETAKPWIRLKHTGDNEGVGTWQWGAKEKQRFNKEFGKKSPALQVLELVEQHGNLPSDARAKLDNFPITNLSRFLNDVAVREFLGIEIDEGDIFTTLPSREVMKPLRKVVIDLATGKVNVNQIRHKKDRAKYIEKFDDKDIPDTSQAGDDPHVFGSDLGAPGGATPKPAAKTAAAKGGRSKPRSTHRGAIIPRGCVIRPTEARINDIYLELKDLRVDDLPNAGAIVLRVFFELSIDSYIARHTLAGVAAQDKLRKKLEAVRDDLKKQNKMTDKELKPINVALSNKDDLVSIDTLHAYVHNYQFTPKPDDLKITWDRLELFMKKVWE